MKEEIFMTLERDEKYMRQVAAIYQYTGSLRRTADELGIAYAKVRKILITLGVYETAFSRDALLLRDKGYSVAEIARQLGTTVKKVSAWLPYERIIYNAPEKSQEAVRSENYRKRIEQALENSVVNKYIHDKGRYNKMANTTTNKKSLDGTGTVKEENQFGEPIRLHLKLESEWLDEKEQHILRTHGRSSDGLSITRDILIPPDITLHALHYAIQRLFGWQNSHLHCFRLPDHDYKQLTNNTVRGWGNLIGVLFQTVYPDDVWHARYGDDDYEHGSHKTWLKKKYTGPYRYLGHYERYKIAVDEFMDFVKQFPCIDVYEPIDFTKRERKIVGKSPVIDLTLDELNASLYVDDGTKDLLERLVVSSVLAPEGASLATAAELNQRMIRRRYRGYDSVEEPEVKPVTHKLYYNYDYGDGWVVEITLQENCDDLLKSGLLSDGELLEARNTVIEKHRPVCIRQDGMFLVDDVGGPSGFVRMLQILYGIADIEEKRSMQEWAYFMGWSTRKVSNKAML
jgi:predicted transcriptional regulator